MDKPFLMCTKSYLTNLIHFAYILYYICTMNYHEHIINQTHRCFHTEGFDSLFFWPLSSGQRVRSGQASSLRRLRRYESWDFPERCSRLWRARASSRHWVFPEGCTRLWRARASCLMLAYSNHIMHGMSEVSQISSSSQIRH